MRPKVLETPKPALVSRGELISETSVQFVPSQDSTAGDLAPGLTNPLAAIPSPDAPN